MNLDQVRDRIDQIDGELLRLLEERFAVSLRTRKLKTDIQDTERENAVINRAQTTPLGLVQKEFSGDLFAKIIGESKRLQASIESLVAFQGENGAYSEVAARELLPDNAAFIPCTEFTEVFDGVERNLFDMGVVPVENALEGAVTAVNDLLAETSLSIVGDVRVPIHHCLLAPTGADYREIREVYSHPQALAQCREFLKRNKLQARPYYDTAGAALMIASQQPSGAAAIASELSAELYNLQVVKQDIEDKSSNYTRFLLLSRTPAKEGNKCSLVFSMPHESGALLSILERFSGAGLNLTRIFSMPLRSDPGNYRFYLDFDGSAADEQVESVLRMVEQTARTYKFLGCYPSDLT